MGSIVADAKQLADSIETVRATHDPAVADANRPCVLVGPPRIDYTELTNSWVLYALASQPYGSLAALAELDALVQAVAAQLPVERAEPVTYALRPGANPVPAYALYVTT